MPSGPLFVPTPGSTVTLDVIARHLASMPEDAVLTHRTAAQLWGLWIPAFDGIEVSSPAGARGSTYTTSVQRAGVVAHRNKLSREQVTERFGFRVSTIEATWLMLASILDVHDLIAAGDRALRLGAEASTMAELIKQSSKLRGVRKARLALPHLDAASESRPESRIRAAVVLAGLPKPEVNVDVVDEYGQWQAKPDLLYRRAKIALEYNGADHADVRRMRKDSTRTLQLQRLGWAVRVYTAPHAHQRLHEVVDDVAILLAQRDPGCLTRAQLRRVTRMHTSGTRVVPSLGA